MFNAIAILSLWILLSMSYANTNDALMALDAKATAAISSVSTETLKTIKNQSDSQYKVHQDLIATFLAKSKSKLSQKKRLSLEPNAILFVSMSMPESLLFQLADEAAYFGIPIVIRGLVQNDFKATIEMIAHLNQEAKKQHRQFNGVSIDPIWFEQFHIESIPALVVSTGSQDCQRGSICPNLPFDVVYGNVSLKKSLSLIAERGSAAPKVAKDILEKGHV